MGKIFRLLVIALFVFGVTWLYMMWQWQVGNHLVSPRDIMLRLFVMPLAITAGIAYVMRYVQMARSARDQINSAAASDEAIPEKKPVPQNGPWLQVVQSAVVTATGSSLDEILQAQLEQPVPQLDEELSSEAGLPLRARRVPGLEMSPAEDDAEAAEMSHGEQRALALLREVLGQTTETLVLLAEVMSLVEPKHKPSSAKAAQLHPAWNGEYVPDETPVSAPSLRYPRSLDIIFAVAPDVSEAFKTAATRLLHSTLDAQKLPPTKLAMRFLAATEQRPLEMQLNQEIEQAHADRRARVMLILASNSTISQSDVERWEGRGELTMDQRGQLGKMPGEAACCIIAHNARFELPALPGLARLPLWTLAETPEKTRLATLWEQLAERDPEQKPKPGLALFSCQALSKTAVDSARFISNELPPLAEQDGGYACLGLMVGDCQPASDLVSLALALQASATQQHAVLLAINTANEVRALCVIDPLEAPEPT